MIVRFLYRLLYEILSFLIILIIFLWHLIDAVFFIFSGMRFNYSYFYSLVNKIKWIEEKGTYDRKNNSSPS